MIWKKKHIYLVSKYLSTEHLVITEGKELFYRRPADDNLIEWIKLGSP